MDAGELNHLIGLVERVAREAATDQVRIELEGRHASKRTRSTSQSSSLDDQILALLRSRGPMTVRTMQMALRGAAKAADVRSILNKQAGAGHVAQEGANYRLA